VVRIAREAELITLGTLAIDGTKVRANASKHKAMSYGRMREEEDRLSKEVDELCRQARRTDESEDRQFGSDHRGDELPEELQYRQARLDKIRAAKEKLEADQTERDKGRGDPRTMIAAHPVEARTSNGITGCRMTRIRATLRTHRAGS